MSKDNPLTNIDHALGQARVAWLGAMDQHIGPLGVVDLPEIPKLTARHLENCVVLPDRNAVLHHMKQRGRVAEIGVQTGLFSQTILEVTKPECLHLFDINFTDFSVAAKFDEQIQNNLVFLHEGDSSTSLVDLPDKFFDFIYIDADHTYEGISKDIIVAKEKISKNGFLVFNDYTYWSPGEAMRYGVIQAVNELCLQEDWEIRYFAFHPIMYCDVAIRRKI